MSENGRYRIQSVAEMTGVSAATLRAWERRYGVPTPSRTASAYRLYGDEDVALVAQRPEAQGYRAVMALCEWLVEGRAPSKVNNMPIDILLKENIPYYKNNII